MALRLATLYNYQTAQTMIGRLNAMNTATDVRPVLETKRTRIVRITRRQKKELLEVIDTPEQKRYDPFDLNSIDEMLKLNELIPQRYLVIDRQSEEVVGAVLAGTKIYHTREIGFSVRKKFQHKGYALEVGQSMIKKIFDLDPDVQRIVAITKNHEAMGPLLEKLGMMVSQVSSKTEDPEKDPDALWSYEIFRCCYKPAY
jgi:RimJ/RimL family protein N-acetyltransferase